MYDEEGKTRCQTINMKMPAGRSQTLIFRPDPYYQVLHNFSNINYF